jgi:UDP-glucose 4-epimerase
VASNRLARELLSWEPRMKFMDGLHRTIDWYFGSRERETVGGYLAEMLTER